MPVLSTTRPFAAAALVLLASLATACLGPSGSSTLGDPGLPPGGLSSRLERAARSAVLAPPPALPVDRTLALQWGAGGPIGRGKTLASALASHGIEAAAVQELVGALRPHCDFRRLSGDATYDLCLHVDDGIVRSFTLRPDALTTVEVLRDDEGRLHARRAETELRATEAHVEATITTSLYQALDDAGESPDLATHVADVFAWDLDFTRDQHPGDRFRMVFEKWTDGKDVNRPGRILAAEYVGARGTHRAFWFSPDGSDARGHYYLEDGQSAEKTLLATPLQFTRISSRFNRNRRHPILGYTRAHNGTDFAAPRGTPVRSMANGRVTLAGRSGGSGNLVVVEHDGGISTHYAHLDRIASGIRRGTRVKQKTLLGTVGSTGLATGPHLHLGMKRGGRWIDPQSVKSRRAEPLPARDRDEFRSTVAARVAALAEPRTPELALALLERRFVEAN